MTKTQRAIIDSAYAYEAAWENNKVTMEDALRLLRAVADDRKNTDPEPEAMTPEAKALIEAILEWRTKTPYTNGLDGELIRHHDAYLASLKPKPKLGVPWPDAVDALRRARFAEMRRQYPDASDADIDAALDAFAKDGAK